MRALSSPVNSLRWEALGDAWFLGDAAGQVLPTIASLLDDPRYRERAAEAVSVIFHECKMPEERTEAEVDALVEWAREKLRQAGVLLR